MDVPAAIKGLRKARRWTQARLAAELQCGVSTVANWEQGLFEPRPSLYSRLAKLTPEGDLRQFFAERGGDAASSSLEDRIADLETRIAAIERVVGLAQQMPPGVRVETAQPLSTEDLMAEVQHLRAQLADMQARSAIREGTTPARVKRAPVSITLGPRAKRVGGGGML